jgi:putative PIN family toxin of toxin-antitoxin system
MLRVVIDTNVYISALNFGGVPEEIIALARRGDIALFISEPILNEIEGVLHRKFAWTRARSRQALAEIQRFTTVVKTSEMLAVITEDESDNRILECGLAAGAELLISGDSHLKALNQFRNILILSPRAFLDLARRLF